MVISDRIGGLGVNWKYTRMVERKMGILMPPATQNSMSRCALPERLRMPCAIISLVRYGGATSMLMKSSPTVFHSIDVLHYRAGIEPAYTTASEPCPISATRTPHTSLEGVASIVSLRMCAIETNEEELTMDHRELRDDFSHSTDLGDVSSLRAF